MGVLVFDEVDFHVVLGFQITVDAQVVLAEFVHQARTYNHPAVDHAERGFQRGNAATAMAYRAEFRLLGHEVHAHALAGHFHHAELANLRGADRRLVAADRPAEFLEHGLAVAIRIHDEELDDDKATHIPKAQLLRNLAAGEEVRLEGDLVRILTAVTAHVHIDGHERFRLFDNEIAVVAERDAAL